jgi:hypothetical protein
MRRNNFVFSFNLLDGTCQALNEPWSLGDSHDINGTPFRMMNKEISELIRDKLINASMYVEVYELSQRREGFSVYYLVRIYIPTIVHQGIAIELTMMMEMNIGSCGVRFRPEVLSHVRRH